MLRWWPSGNKTMDMDERFKNVSVPARMRAYAEEHEVCHMMQDLLSNLLIEKPEDPKRYMIRLLRRTNPYRRSPPVRSQKGSCGSGCDQSDLCLAPRVMLIGPPAVGKYTMAKRLSTELNVVLVTKESIQQKIEQSKSTEQGDPNDLLALLVQQRVRESDCFNNGWLLEGFPQTHLQALALQRVGVLPEHVVMLEAPATVLLARNQGRMLDPLTKDVYHESLVLPADARVAERLEIGQRLSEEQLLARLHRYNCEFTGLRSAYQGRLKVVDTEQPQNGVYQEVLAFIQIRKRDVTAPPRVLLLGPPGSGKSHQAALLSETHKMVDVCCDQALRSAAADGTNLGKKVREYLDRGNPVPHALVLQVLELRLSLLECTCNGWVLHGLPSDLKLAQSLQKSLNRPNRVFFLEAKDEVCLERITLRATDPVTGQRFHTLSQPAPSSEVRDRLQTRPEDRTEAVAQRLEEYRSYEAHLKSRLYTN
ncbi:adenylate kinase 8 [Cololabis saira]|uniref:adenylate kinase 8 n=1 Tax=Cololabis saira TaxID=129043 RepID=UPI002AD36387|nr:adenylate kinase 8 [Cololabis saira]